MKPLLLGIFEGDGIDEVIEHLASTFREPQLGIGELLVAIIEPYDYDESAWVLYLGTDGELYEVSGGHCSCYGFEGQWEPTKSSVPYLLSEHFSCGCGSSNNVVVKAWLNERFNG